MFVPEWARLTLFDCIAEIVKPLLKMVGRCSFLLTIKGNISGGDEDEVNAYLRQRARLL